MESVKFSKIKFGRLRAFNSGYYRATEDMTHFINSFDSEEMSGNEVRSALYAWALEARPYGKFKTERDPRGEETDRVSED